MLTHGIAVHDRQTGSFLRQDGENGQFRSASLVKLLIALDVLWEHGPDHDLPAADRARLEPMLHSSEDAPASRYWEERGGSAILDRTVSRLGLTGTAPPPPSHPGFWGYTATTAADTVRVHRYLLDEAPPPVRDFVLRHLRETRREAADGYDQFFGIPSVFAQPWAVKQGWSGFNPGGYTEADRAASRAGVDLVGGALHTSGTVGPDDRYVIAVLTLHPEGTPYDVAYSAVTRLVGSLDLPGTTRM